MEQGVNRITGFIEMLLICIALVLLMGSFATLASLSLAAFLKSIGIL